MNIIRKKYAIITLQLLGQIIGLIFNQNIIAKLRKLKNHIFSGIVKGSFKSIGSNFFIEYPIIAHGCKYITIGKNFQSFAGLRIEAFDSHNGYHFHPKIIIGDNVSLNYDCHIACINKIEIGNNVLFASKIFITDHFHGDVNTNELKIPPSLRKLISKGPVIIEDNVWIGESVVILPNVTIGKNSIIGANSVVTKSFPVNSVIAGVPANLLKSL